MTNRVEWMIEAQKSLLMAMEALVNALAPGDTHEKAPAKENPTGAPDTAYLHPGPLPEPEVKAERPLNDAAWQALVAQTTDKKLERAVWAALWEETGKYKVQGKSLIERFGAIYSDGLKKRCIELARSKGWEP